MPWSGTPPSDLIDPREPCTYRCGKVNTAEVLYQGNEGYYEDIACTLKHALFGGFTRSFAIYDVGFFSTFMLDNPVPLNPADTTHVFVNAGSTGHTPRTWCLAFIAYTTVSHLRTLRERLQSAGVTSEDEFGFPFWGDAAMQADLWSQSSYRSPGGANKYFPEGVQSRVLKLYLEEPPDLILSLVFDGWPTYQQKVNQLTWLRLGAPAPSMSGPQPLHLHDSDEEPHGRDIADELPEPPLIPGTEQRLSSLWLLGEYRARDLGAYAFFCDPGSQTNDRWVAWHPDKDASLPEVLEATATADLSAGTMACFERNEA
ncbi:hypothetical protein [Ferrimicrobium sp.]|uniref:hypothetical protein n=1 Tax=Ferrimicrobium sp. TaxID=2926050 RepID=UPI00260AB6F3|nr:hypothetical protein [Ferrimicrobium sp.]